MNKNLNIKLKLTLAILSILVFQKNAYSFAESFDTVDKNKNNIITWDEAKKSKWTIQKFNFIDFDKNKKVTHEEFWSRISLGMELLYKPDKKTLSLIEILDMNYTKKVSFTEWDFYFGETADEYFPKIDNNKDDAITKKELKNFINSFLTFK